MPWNFGSFVDWTKAYGIVKKRLPETNKNGFSTN
jgi:hypothetical protein